MATKPAHCSGVSTTCIRPGVARSRLPPRNIHAAPRGEAAIRPRSPVSTWPLGMSTWRPAAGPRSALEISTLYQRKICATGRSSPSTRDERRERFAPFAALHSCGMTLAIVASMYRDVVGSLVACSSSWRTQVLPAPGNEYLQRAPVSPICPRRVRSVLGSTAYPRPSRGGVYPNRPYPLTSPLERMSSPGRRLLGLVNPRCSRGGDAARLHGISSVDLSSRTDALARSSPLSIRCGTAASLRLGSTEYPRPSRGVAAIHQRGIRAAEVQYGRRRARGVCPAHWRQRWPAGCVNGCRRQVLARLAQAELVVLFGYGSHPSSQEQHRQHSRRRHETRSSTHAAHLTPFMRR